MKNMLWYSLGAVKNYYLSQTFHNDNCRDTVKQLFANLFHIIDFDDILVHNDKLLINQYDCLKIDNVIKYYISKFSFVHKVNSIIPHRKSYSLKNKNNDSIIGEFTLNFSKNLESKGFKNTKYKRKILTRHIENLNNIKSVNRVLSFDFEYNSTSIYGISEIGYTIYYPQKELTESHHVIISGKENKSRKKINLEKNFLYGESRESRLNCSIDELQHLIRKSDYILGHDIINELKVLGVAPNWKKIIDTKFCDMTLNNRDTYQSLSNILREYGVKHQYLHNAGNDARITLELALVMYGDLNGNNLKNVVGFK
jgi:hypothetical protein